MSLAASMSKFKSEMSDAASRNLAHSRPTSTAPARVSTPLSGTKRPAEGNIVSQAPVDSRPFAAVGSELMSHVITAQAYLKEKFPNSVSFENIIAYLSLPTDLQKHKSLIKIALQNHQRITFTAKSASPNSKEAFQYNPIYPVASSDELLTFLATRTTFAGLLVKDLKDVWKTYAEDLDALERQHKILIMRNKKDNSARIIWPDDPSLHKQVEDSFMDFWSKTKLPTIDVEVRTELEKAGLTPTSQVKEIRKVEPRKKEKRRINRISTKTTNSHMSGILKDYSRK